jgi:hypothetical protein
LAFLLALIITILREPSLVFHAQFYAEDALTWFGQAYHFGWLNSLAMPDVGYLNTLPRLGAGLEMLVPFRWAPLAGILFGALVQCLPVPIVLSVRCRNWGNLSQRSLIAAVYVLCPNAREIHMVLTNTQWHLTVAVLFLAFGSAPRGWAGRILDMLLFLLCGLSGPFCIVMVPLVALYWWQRRQPWSLMQLASLALCSLVQAHFIATSLDRKPGPLGAGLVPLLRIFGGNVVGGAIFGGHYIGRFAPLPLIVAAALGGLILYVYVLRFANLELKLLVLYGVGLLAASLRSPLALGSKPAWILIADANESRYFYFPMLAFLLGIFWCARYSRHSLIRTSALVTLCFMTIGFLTDFEYKAYPNYDFSASVERLRDAQPGTPVEIPILPRGWHFTLLKKGPPGQINRW